MLEITVARQWRLNAASPRLIEYVEHILQSMEVEAFNSLQTTKFQIAVVPSGIIWAYFPVHKNREVVKAHQIELQSETEVLLVIGEDSIASSAPRTAYSELAHHFGHVLCYLRKPEWVHDCLDADIAARECGLAALLEARYSGDKLPTAT